MNISGVFSGAPDVLDGREQIEIDTYALLLDLGIAFSRVDHDAAATLEECGEIDKVLGTHVCKNLFLCNRQKSAFYLLLLEGNKVFKTKYLSAQIGSSRLSFASADDLYDILGVKPGSASVFALMNDKDHKVQLLIDRPLTLRKDLGFHPCRNTSSLKVEVNDLLNTFLPSVGHEPIVVDLPELSNDDE